jgi:hypothetical protein
MQIEIEDKYYAKDSEGLLKRTARMLPKSTLPKNVVRSHTFQHIPHVLANQW